MATAYVSPVGSASYPGTTISPTSLSTALSSAGSGDIIYLAPGNYRGTFTIGVSGSAGNTIRIIGDVNASQGIGGIAAGIVRITNYINDNLNPTSAVLLTATNRNYWSFSNIYFESYTTSNSAFTLLTCTNWMFEKCIFFSRFSRGFLITTTANVAQNGIFNKCVFNTSSYAIDINAANHSSDYSLNLSITDCVSYATFLQTFNGAAGTNTNAGGISIYNITVLSGFTLQLYQSNTTHPTTIYNSVCINMNNSWAIVNNVNGSVIENYNLIMGSAAGVTAGANSLYSGSIGLDFGYSAINGIPAPSIHGPYLGSRLLGAGIATNAPVTDADGAAWYQSLLGMGAYTYASRNNVIGFVSQPSPNSIIIAPGSTSQSIELYLGVTGLTASTSGLQAYYVRNRSSPVQISLVSQTSTGAWASGGFAEISSGAMPGLYRLDVPDAAFASGSSDVTITVRGASGTNGAVLTVNLTPVNINMSQSVPTSNTAQTVGDALNAARAYGFGKWVINGTNLSLYASDNTTIIKTFTLDSGSYPTSRT
jgi:hypothetical protein